MTDIVMSLLDDFKQVGYYAVVRADKLYVVPKKSLEKKIFWNEIEGYELRKGEIFRANYFPDNMICRILGTSSKEQRVFDSTPDIGVMGYDFFATGNVCVSILDIKSEGYEYICDFVVCSVESTNLYNYYSIIKSDSLIWGTSPYSLRGRCPIDTIKGVRYDSFININDIQTDDNTLKKYIEYLKLWTTMHNEDLITKFV